MEAASISEFLINFYQTTQCNNSEDSHLEMGNNVVCLHFMLAVQQIVKQINVNMLSAPCFRQRLLAGVSWNV
jgi:hypothetical protein